MESVTFVLLGATGDLAKRKIIPALYSLYVDQKMPPLFSLIGVSISELSDEEFHDHVEQSINTFSESMSKNLSKMKEFLQIIRYCKLDVTNESEYQKLLDLVQKREKEF
jgi:glucose-6-phosphate 1-dehydrogenase